MFIDSHAHVDEEGYPGEIPEVLDRARENQVTAIINVGIDEATSRRACALAEQEEDVYFAPGIHPHDADEKPSLKPFASLADHSKAVAVGETGLDYFKGYATKENQEILLRQHFELARKIKKPLIIHCRDAHADMIRFLREEKDLDGVIHCFTGTVADAEAYMEMGFYISIAGPVTYPSAGDLRETVKHLPLDRLMVETDCPLLAPQAYRGKRNEPAYVRYVAAEIAKVHQCSLELVGEKTSENTRRIFRL